MTYAANLNRFGVRTNEEESIITDSQSQFCSSLKSFHVACARFCEAMEGMENLHGVWLA